MKPKKILEIFWKILEEIKSMCLFERFYLPLLLSFLLVWGVRVGSQIKVNLAFKRTVVKTMYKNRSRKVSSMYVDRMGAADIQVLIY